MKNLIFNEECLKAETIVKTETDIIGYNENKEVFAFRGISDFTLFRLEEGQKFDISKELKLDLSIAESYENLYTESLQNSLAIAEIYEMMKGGL